METNQNELSAIVPRLFLLGVGSPESFSAAFSGCVNYSLTWKQVWAAYNGKKGRLSLASDEMLLLTCNSLLQPLNKLPESAQGIVDILVILNPKKEVTELLDFWPTVGARIYIHGGADAGLLYQLETQLTAINAVREGVDAIRQSGVIQLIRSEFPFVSDFIAETTKTRKNIIRTFEDRFLV